MICLYSMQDMLWSQSCKPTCNKNFMVCSILCLCHVCGWTYFHGFTKNKKFLMLSCNSDNGLVLLQHSAFCLYLLDPWSVNMVKEVDYFVSRFHVNRPLTLIFQIRLKVTSCTPRYMFSLFLCFVAAHIQLSWIHILLLMLLIDSELLLVTLRNPFAEYLTLLLKVNSIWIMSESCILLSEYHILILAQDT